MGPSRPSRRRASPARRRRRPRGPIRRPSRGRCRASGASSRRRTTRHRGRRPRRPGPGAPRRWAGRSSAAARPGRSGRRTGSSGAREQVVLALAGEVDLLLDVDLDLGVGLDLGERGRVVEGEVLVVVHERGRGVLLLAEDVGPVRVLGLDRVGVGQRVEALAAATAEPGDRVEAGAAGRAHVEVGRIVASEREAQGRAGPDRRGLGPVAVAGLVVAPTGRDVAALERLGRLLGADDADALGGVARSIVFGSSELVVHLGPPLASISPRAAPAPCAGAPRRSRPPGRG